MNPLWNSIVENSLIHGKSFELKLILSSFLGSGHVLIEDVPGVGKTTLVKYLAQSLGLELKRIQFTSDLLPQEILGYNRFNGTTQSFVLVKGPIFGEVILADELNRAPPKTQSALLQSMEEGEVSIDGEILALPEPFFVVATQNPFTQVGTYPLPESQLDRFALKISLGHPDMESTFKMLKGSDSKELLKKVKALGSKEMIQASRDEVDKVHVEESLYAYIAEFLFASRSLKGAYALSSRAGQDLLKVSKGLAYLSGRDYLIPDDVQKCVPYVFSHRLVGPYQTSEEGKKLANELLSLVKVP